MAKRTGRSQNPKPDDTARADDRAAEPAAASPSEEEIRQRAYDRYLQRGGGHGMDFEDWLEAERELKSLK